MDVASTIMALLVWINIQTGWEVPPVEHFPEVVVYEQEDVYELYCAGAGLPIDCEFPRVMKVVAYYDETTDDIIIAKELLEDDLYSTSVLLHELIHYMQDYHDLEYPCNTAKEPIAYTLQSEWLAEHGVEWKANQLMIAIMSICHIM